MKFGKTYSALLPVFPRAWQERAISYGELKKLINDVVNELSRLGLDPTVLNQLLQAECNSFGSMTQNPNISAQSRIGIEDDLDGSSSSTDCEHNAFGLQFHPHAVYEVSHEEDRIVPRLHLWADSRLAPFSASTTDESHFEVLSHSGIPTTSVATLKPPNIAQEFPSRPSTLAISGDSQERSVTEVRVDQGSFMGCVNDVNTDLPVSLPEVVFILTTDAAFYQRLETAIQLLAEHQKRTQEEFSHTINTLARDLSHVTHPSSRSPTSDLYPWRQILQLWMETGIFESNIEKDRGERDVEAAARRLVLFANEVSKRWLNDHRTLKNKDSRAVLVQFLHLNMFLLELKKFHRANEEAVRKILKKHNKRTALRIPPAEQDRLLPMHTVLPPKSSDREIGSLIHILVVQVTEILLPVIPFIEGYECLICASIAYIPIRLRCSHLFCVRCLVKMQKRGLAECPLCRSPTVLQADRTNVDAALKRFMVEWFPVETKEKEKANEREAAEEELREMGFNPADNKCLVQ
ncbi:hypothetical protein BS47DRAFT_1381548 [Hydnum rufescens UP504]|uniref:RING-14 protein n=1 Tax=Hydnum rufescens UP504 TaxID=1448309 RepID=A0A9P6B1N2_9AGAM|nr:hypothetical protein BS47DRAFT_1381548 [Hydnum rufescens UP504]